MIYLNIIKFIGGKMEFYKTFKKIAVVGFLAALPTICDPSCAYRGNKSYAAETRQELKQEVSATESQTLEKTLETVLEK